MLEIKSWCLTWVRPMSFKCITTYSCTANVWVLYVYLELVKVRKVFSNFIQVVNFLDFCQNIKKSHKLKLIWKVLSRTFDKKSLTPGPCLMNVEKYMGDTDTTQHQNIFPPHQFNSKHFQSVKKNCTILSFY